MLLYLLSYRFVNSFSHCGLLTHAGNPGPPLWAGKPVALLMTCGYRPETGCDLFETGMRRYCKHSQLQYLGSHAERHLGYDTVFMDAGKEARTRAFAQSLIQMI